jgi:hypothetical protein
LLAEITDCGFDSHRRLAVGLTLVTVAAPDVERGLVQFAEYEQAPLQAARSFLGIGGHETIVVLSVGLREIPCDRGAFGQDQMIVLIDLGLKTAAVAHKFH